MKKIVLLFMICTIFASCIGIKNVVTINKDLSGTVQWNYKLDNSIYQLGHLGDQTKELPLPVLKEDFLRVCDLNKGLSLQAYNLSEDDTSISIKAQIKFSNISDLNALSLKTDQGAQWAVAEKSLAISLNWDEAIELSDDDKAMIGEFFKGYSLEMVVRVPGPVKSTSLGEISSDKKQVSISLSYMEALELDDDSIEISWE